MARYFPLAALLLVSTTAVGSDPLPLFASDDVLEVTIEAPMFRMSRDDAEAPEYREGKFSYLDTEGATQTFDIRIRPRGKNRRKKDVCQYPPLRLNFSSKQVKDTLFHKQDKLKLVVSCRRGSAYEQYLLQEYLVYKVYNLLSEQSFRVRLLNATFIDSDGDARTRSGPAFLIEDRKHMAGRSGYKYQPVESIRRYELDQPASTLLGVFQYFIGNTDWSMIDGPEDDPCCHNAILVAKDDGPYVPVPYDFDYSGIINTPYAIPAKSAKVKSVRKRAYRGFCQPPDVLQGALQRMREQKQAIYALYTQDSGLTSANVKKTRRYIDEFYATIDDPRQLEKRIVSRCR